MSKFTKYQQDLLPRHSLLRLKTGSSSKEETMKIKNYSNPQQTWKMKNSSSKIYKPLDYKQLHKIHRVRDIPQKGFPHYLKKLSTLMRVKEIVVIQSIGVERWREFNPVFKDWQLLNNLRNRILHNLLARIWLRLLKYRGWELDDVGVVSMMILFSQKFGLKKEVLPPKTLIKNLELGNSNLITSKMP